PVVGSHGGWQSDDGFPDDRGSGGRAHVVVTFYLNASNAAAPNVVRFTVNVSAWPWSNASDHLGLPMNSTAANSTRLVAGAGPNQILEVRNGSANTTVAALSWDSEASVAYNGSMSNTSSVGTFEALGVNGSNSSIRLSFGAVSGGYSELSYDPLVQLNLSAFQPRTLAPPILLQGHWLPAWDLTQSTLEVTAAGILVVSLLGIAAWRNRARPEPPP
ncbi:MAG: hypothetical protein L3K05_05430, partial [Thermoplasmata archaeon]|nr:hypothetical protein [Thermoplasmata archaeon]